MTDTRPTGPGRFRFLLGHTYCCRHRGHRAGWCSEPARYDAEVRTPRQHPEPLAIEIAIANADLDCAIATLPELERIAVEAWARICHEIGYPPLDNDKLARWRWRDRARPLWKLVVRRHRIAPDHEGDRSGTRRLQDALWSACETMARATGWLPRDER